MHVNDILNIRNLSCGTHSSVVPDSLGITIHIHKIPPQRAISQRKTTHPRYINYTRNARSKINRMFKWYQLPASGSEKKGSALGIWWPSEWSEMITGDLRGFPPGRVDHFICRVQRPSVYAARPHNRLVPIRCARLQSAITRALLPFLVSFFPCTLNGWVDVGEDSTHWNPIWSTPCGIRVCVCRLSHRLILLVMLVTDHMDTEYRIESRRSRLSYLVGDIACQREIVGEDLGKNAVPFACLLYSSSRIFRLSVSKIMIFFSIKLRSTYRKAWLIEIHH